MQRLGSFRQPLRSFMASATPRCLWWSSSLSRPAHPSVSQFPHGSRNMASSIGVKGEDLGSKTYRRSLNSPASIEGYEKGGSRSVISGDEDACGTTLEVKPDADAAGGAVGITGCEPRSNVGNDKQRRAAPVPDYLDDDDDVPPMIMLLNGTHRDGSIYRDIHDDTWKREFGVANRNETPIEAMRFSHPSADCFIRDGICMSHTVSNMLQIFSLRLAKIPVEHGKSVELYGYIAARDCLDSLLNYFINVSRDDPIIVKEGSLINMAGSPKRGIVHLDETLIEYDMKIKTGKHENEDLQLIDGASPVGFIDTPNCGVFTDRIHGDCGAIDVTAACIYGAVEATVEVAILQVQDSFRMRLSCFTSGIDKEIRLFNGAIGEPCALKRFVVAVHEKAQIRLVFKLDAELCLDHCCSFKANKHGHDSLQIKNIDFASIVVKVTWSTIW